jgi:hypothetical protein
MIITLLLSINNKILFVIMKIFINKIFKYFQKLKNKIFN